ncbi:AraC family transcriptional regulator [Bradyrhizobium sp. Leo121]|uniref:AraC family transcriptional regulator n=1 Tax=Bradyrhizobium sp. Leo121 TaxID=1571195 RepID=UPI0010288EF0|nr:AraC family transcriptional regulator [Bradyrhizobium sp. Leo121]
MNDSGRLAPLTVSTDEFPEAKRLAMWREVYGRNIANVDIEPIDDAPFQASVTFQALPGVGIVSGSRSAAHYHITREHLAKSKDLVGLSVLISGKSTTSQFGREIVGRAGSGVVLSATDPSVSTMHCHGSFLTIALPRPDLAALVPDLGAAYARQIPPDNDALRLLIRYVEALRQGGPAEAPGLMRTAATHVIDLAALAIGATQDFAEAARGRGLRAARLEAVKADIEDNLGRPDLDIVAIAQRQGISPSYIRKLFEAEGTSFSAFVLEQRLARAYRMLKDLRFADRAIGAIAFQVGFGDLSYFNRTFRRAYGLTPSDVRAMAVRAGLR